MSAKRKTSGTNKSVDVHKLHAEYNLEKDPLQTGKTTSRTTWRSRIVMGWGIRGFRSLAILLWIILIVAIGAAAIRLFTLLIDRLHAAN